MYRQPKYKFGDKFSKQVETTIKGNRFELKIIGYIVGIRQICCETDYEHDYQYRIDNTFSFFGSGREHIEVVSEGLIDRVWTYEG